MSDAEVVSLWQWARERWPYKGAVAAYDARLEAQSESKEQEGTLVQESEDIDIGLGAEVTPIKRLQPGDLLSVVIQLRQLANMYDNCSFTLYASFEDLGGKPLDKEAEKARHTLELAASRVYSLLAAIEKTSYFQELRASKLEQRKTRAAISSPKR